MKVGILERKIDRNCSSSEIIKLCELSLEPGITLSFVLRVEKSSKPKSYQNAKLLQFIE